MNKNIAVPFVYIAVAIPSKKKAEKIGRVLKSVALGRGILSNLILLIIAKETTIDMVIIIGSCHVIGIMPLSCINTTYEKIVIADAGIGSPRK